MSEIARTPLLRDPHPSPPHLAAGAITSSSSPPCPQSQLGFVAHHAFLFKCDLMAFKWTASCGQALPCRCFVRRLGLPGSSAPRCGAAGMGGAEHQGSARSERWDFSFQRLSPALPLRSELQVREPRWGWGTCWNPPGAARGGYSWINQHSLFLLSLIRALKELGYFQSPTPP